MHQPGAFQQIKFQTIQQAVQMACRFCSPLHGKPRRFIDRNQLLILVNDQTPYIVLIFIGEFTSRHPRFDLLQRRNAHYLPRRKALAGLNPRPVDSHLPRSQQLLKLAMGQGRIMRTEPAIQADILFGLRNNFLLNPGHLVELFLTSKIKKIKAKDSWCVRNA